MRPAIDEYAKFYAGYIALVPEEDIANAMAEQTLDFITYWNQVPENLAGTIQSPYTWTIRDALWHLADCERIFGYRFLRVIRGDQTELPGFEENDYVAASQESPCQLSDLVAQIAALRNSNLLLVRSASAQAMSRQTIINQHPITARALAYIMVGHIRHHDQILRRRIASAMQR